MVAAKAVEVAVNAPARSSKVVAAQSGAVATVKAMELLVAYSVPLGRSRVRNFGGALAATVNLISCVSAPTVLLWHCATGAHQPVERLSVPDQGADQRPN